MSDYFALLNISPSFDIDLAQFEAAYFREQRSAHPDRFVGKSEQERLAAMQRSVDINKAYQVLKEPLTRAQYLLKLQGITVGSEQDSVKPSQALLVEVMEWREDGIEKNNLSNIHEESLQTIASAYKNQQWEIMAQETLRLGYIMSILRHAEGVSARSNAKRDPAQSLRASQDNK
jgi:Fe-S protein assembly co-chaperone HscB